MVWRLLNFIMAWFTCIESGAKISIVHHNRLQRSAARSNTKNFKRPKNFKSLKISKSQVKPPVLKSAALSHVVTCVPLPLSVSKHNTHMIHTQSCSFFCSIRVRSKTQRNPASRNRNYQLCHCRSSTWLTALPLSEYSFNHSKLYLRDARSTKYRANSTLVSCKGADMSSGLDGIFPDAIASEIVSFWTLSLFVECRHNHQLCELCRVGVLGNVPPIPESPSPISRGVLETAWHSVQSYIATILN